MYDLYETHLGVELPTGRSGVDVVADGKPSWSGAASSGSAYALWPFAPSPQAAINQTVIYQLTPGGFTKDTNFLFDITQFSIGAVPEPATWGLMIAGFGLVGGAMRRRHWRDAAAR